MCVCVCLSAVQNGMVRFKFTQIRQKLQKTDINQCWFKFKPPHDFERIFQLTRFKTGTKVQSSGRLTIFVINLSI